MDTSQRPPLGSAVGTANAGGSSVDAARERAVDGYGLDPTYRFDAVAARDYAIKWMKPHERGYVDHPSDPGGATNDGVSLRFARDKKAIRGVRGQELLNFDLDNDGDIDADDIRALSDEQKRIVYIDIWNRFDFAALGHHKIAAKFYDLSLPMGYGGASRVMQRAMRSCRYTDLVEDGYVGPISRATIRDACRWNATAVMTAVCSEAAGYFRDLDAPEFEEGWLNRAYKWP